MSCCDNPTEHPNPRAANSCVRCGRTLSVLRPRNIELERELTESAAKAGGFILPDGRGDTGGIVEMGERRAWPGGIRPDINHVRETQEEYADARNYLVWGIEPLYERYVAGDPRACEQVARDMNSLMRLIQAWQELRI